MNDALKHTVGAATSIGGIVGAITLHDVNEAGTFACWIIGCAAGLCTIHSWWRSHQNSKK